MLSFGVGSRILLAPQPDGPSGGGYPVKGPSDPGARAFSHSRALPLDEAFEVLMVECLRNHIASLAEPGLLPEFCLRHESLKAFIKDRPGFNQLMRKSWGGEETPKVVLGAACATQGEDLGTTGLHNAVRSAIGHLSLCPTPSAGDAHVTQNELESVIAKRIDRFFQAFLARFFKANNDERVDRNSFDRWIDPASLDAFCSSLAKDLEKPREVAFRLLGKSKHFEVMNALSEEQSLSCAELLVDYAVVELLSSHDIDWINCHCVRLVNRGEQRNAQTSLGDELFAAVSSSWEARRCACRELVVMSAEEFFDRFPPFAEFESHALARVRVVILPSLEDEAPARLFVFRHPMEEGGLPESLVRDLEWVAFKYCSAFPRIQSRAHDEA